MDKKSRQIKKLERPGEQQLPTIAGETGHGVILIDVR
jgi:hypothetical protein